MNNSTIIAIGGTIGILIHALVKIDAINGKLAQESYKTVLLKYWVTERWKLLLSFAFVGAIMFVASELIGLDIDKVEPTGAVTGKLLKFIRVLSVGVGYLADGLVYKWLGSTEKKLIQEKVAEGVPMSQIINTPATK